MISYVPEETIVLLFLVHQNGANLGVGRFDVGVASAVFFEPVFLEYLFFG